MNIKHINLNATNNPSCPFISMEIDGASFQECYAKALEIKEMLLKEYYKAKEEPKKKEPLCNSCGNAEYCLGGILGKDNPKACKYNCDLYEEEEDEEEEEIDACEWIENNIIIDDILNFYHITSMNVDFLDLKELVAKFLEEEMECNHILEDLGIYDEVVYRICEIIEEVV